jgi:hypothetical protein
MSAAGHPGPEALPPRWRPKPRGTPRSQERKFQDGRHTRRRTADRGPGGHAKIRDPPMKHYATRPGHLKKQPRCGARTRAGAPCQRPAVRSRKRCRLHGCRLGPVRAPSTSFRASGRGPGGHAKIRDQPMKHAGQRLHPAVMFSDLVGSTALSARMDQSASCCSSVMKLPLSRVTRRAVRRLPVAQGSHQVPQAHIQKTAPSAAK